MGSVPVGVQCLLTSSLGEFLGYWAGSGILGYRPCWYLSPFPSPSMHISACFHSLFSRHWISFVFFIYSRCICTHSVDPSLTHFLGEFPGLGLALDPDVLVPEAEYGCARAEISIQISALARIEI